MFNSKYSIDFNYSEYFENRRLCNFGGIGAVAPIIGAGVSAIGGMNAASSSADALSAAANQSAQLQAAIYQQNRTDLSPYRNLGYSALNPLISRYGLGAPAGPDNPPQDSSFYATNPSPLSLLAPYTNSVSNLAPFIMGNAANATNAAGNIGSNAGGLQYGLASGLQTVGGYLSPMGSTGYPQALQNAFSNFTGSPDYQFARDEGMRRTNSALNAQGLSYSGGQARGLSEYTTGLASQNYNSYVNNVLNSLSNQYNAANTYSNMSNAAVNAGNLGINAANLGLNAGTQANNLISQYLNAGGQTLNADQLGGNLYNQYFNQLASLAGIGQTASNQTANLGANAGSAIGNNYLQSGTAQASGIVGGYNAAANSLNSPYVMNSLSGLGNLFGSGSSSNGWNSSYSGGTSGF